MKSSKTQCVNCGRNMTPLKKSLAPKGKGWKSRTAYNGAKASYYCGRC